MEKVALARGLVFGPAGNSIPTLPDIRIRSASILLKFDRCAERLGETFVRQRCDRLRIAMVQKVITSPANVVDFVRYRNALTRSQRICGHCGAVLSEGEREEECSSAFNIGLPLLSRGARTFYAD
jgi:hypothetical protein